MQKELNKFCYEANNRKVRKQKDKLLPSGVSPNIAYEFPERFGATDCLEQVDVRVVEEILDCMQEAKDALSDWGVPKDFAICAQKKYEELSVQEVTMSNVWLVFGSMVNFL